MKGKESTKVRSLLFAGKYGTLLCLFAMIAVFSILLPAFRSSNNVLNLLGQTAILSIMAAGMTCTLKMGDFDLSIGAIAALTGIVTAKILLAGGGIPLAIASGLVTGLMVGFINGIFVAYIGLNAFVCTLATMSIIFGLMPDGHERHHVIRPARGLRFLRKRRCTRGSFPFHHHVLSAACLVVLPQLHAYWEKDGGYRR